MIAKVLNFIKRDVWRMRLRDLPKKKSFLLRQLRTILLALRGFNEDKCQLRASALTFYSLLSIVPVMAMAFGVAKGFGFEKMLEKQLLDKFANQGEVLQQIIGFAQSMLNNTKGGVVAGIGVAVLFWTVIKVLGNIEQSFNDIWGIKQGRAIGRKFSDYLSLMLICPIMIILSSSITVFISTQLSHIISQSEVLGVLAPLVFAIVKILPFAVIWILFTFIYIFLPNTKVNFSSGLIAGIAAGTIYQITQWVYINFQVGVAKFNAIYGSFAALPLFLMWLQISWLVVLFGAEISFAHQNVDTYEFEPDCLEASHSFKRLAALQIAQLIVKNFANREDALNASEISHKLDMPIRLVRQILFELKESKIVAESNGENEKQPRYVPASDIDQFTIQFVLSALDERGVNEVPIARNKEFDNLKRSVDSFKQLIAKSDSNKLLKEI